MSEQNIKEVVKKRYGKAALKVTSGSGPCCSTASSRGECDGITSNLYTAAETMELPGEAVAASLGCGNTAALAQLKEGEIVLDLG